MSSDRAIQLPGRLLGQLTSLNSRTPPIQYKVLTNACKVWYQHAAQ